MNIRRFVSWFAILIASLYLAVLPALAGNRSGTVSELFLRIPTSARAIGIGGAVVTMAEGATSIA